jgi:hypothetical protein
MDTKTEAEKRALARYTTLTSIWKEHLENRYVGALGEYVYQAMEDAYNAGLKAGESLHEISNGH